ncbi:hypothetical protein BJ742DRAFT_772406 [Cladochytrium replicatum]|nr:hypothetical protein BJ742DRAFT_772406 [Cladochytrium replicatum]
MTGSKRYIVSFKSAAQMEQAKAKITEQGGKIVSELNIIKALTVEYPEVSVQSLKSLDGFAAIEEDKEVHIMKH